MVELSISSRHQADSSADCIVIALRALQGKFQPVVRIRGIIDPDFGGRSESSHHQIKFAVMIEVAERRPAVTFRRL
jgi:hypothetical protein